jgi:hypothetical protein
MPIDRIFSAVPASENLAYSSQNSPAAILLKYMPVTQYTATLKYNLHPNPVKFPPASKIQAVNNSSAPDAIGPSASGKAYSPDFVQEKGFLFFENITAKIVPELQNLAPHRQSMPCF